MSIDNETEIMKHYYDNYDNIVRFINYYYQIYEVKNLTIKKILEIGVGNKTVNNYLTHHGFEVISLDLNKVLKPTCIGNVTKLPYKDKSFDCVLCCEVLEHIPFENVQEALNEIYRVSKNYSIISLPYFNIFLSLCFRVPIIMPKHIFIRIPFPIKYILRGDEHYWEIGRKGFSIKKIRLTIKQTGFKVIKELTPTLDPGHYFFVLQRLGRADPE